AGEPRARPGPQPRAGGAVSRGRRDRRAMSATDLSTPLPATPLPAPPRAPVSARGPSVAAWARVALAVAVLLGSAGVRAWQARRIEGELAAGRLKARFDLASVPMELGPWKGVATEIDPQ